MSRGQLHIAMRIASFLNVAIVVLGIVFYVPAFSVSNKYIEEIVESGVPERFMRLVTLLQEGAHAYGAFFMVCFLMLLISALLLWLSARKT